MTIDDPIKCFACGGKHFVRDCPNPDERKGKGKSKGKGFAQGRRVMEVMLLMAVGAFTNSTSGAIGKERKGEPKATARTT